MTTENKKFTPDFYIFERDSYGEYQVGTASWNTYTGTLTLMIGDYIYAAVPSHGKLSPEEARRGA